MAVDAVALAVPTSASAPSVTPPPSVTSAPSAPITTAASIATAASITVMLITSAPVQRHHAAKSAQTNNGLNWSWDKQKESSS